MNVYRRPADPGPATAVLPAVCVSVDGLWGAVHDGCFLGFTLRHDVSYR